MGVNGFGLQHLLALQPLLRAGRCRLVAVADPSPPTGRSEELVGTTPRFASLEDLLADDVPDVVIISTPLHTHRGLAELALRAGSNVLLEKPPTVSLAEFSELCEVVRETGRTVQVGFQSLGSSSYAVIDRAIAAGEIGEVTGIGVVGTWLRATSYYERSTWAGRRTFRGLPVVDGVVTNPLSHAIATALRIDGSRRSEDVSEVSLDLYRAHDIEADDTSSVAVTTARGTRIAAGLTLCAAEQTQPRVVVHGSSGSITFYYKLDVVEVANAAGTRRIECSTTPLLQNLLDHVADPETALLSSLEDSGAFMRVLEAVRTAPDPTPIGDRHVEWRTDSAGRHPVVHEVEHWCEQVASQLRSFTDLGAPWAR
ncbi:Gfo/Idh/MocA family protein [Tessaracoccus rhinocerotis]|uniref:Gfo/Idh/MocA family protein n=1 Tax=Tessaracoccus rhinocerotis TaxID=1689449 RepID=UPI001FE2ED3A|nr:Gfo/Idh/MocA family oxidoreductase [Tessaracoccus rhinocerotis]